MHVRKLKEPFDPVFLVGAQRGVESRRNLCVEGLHRAEAREKVCPVVVGIELSAIVFEVHHCCRRTGANLELPFVVESEGGKRRRFGAQSV